MRVVPKGLRTNPTEKQNYLIKQRFNKNYAAPVKDETYQGLNASPKK